MSMMRLFTIWILFITGFIPILAQPVINEITFSEGEELIIPASGEIPRLFGWDETGYYALGYDHRYYLEHYDRNFNSTGKNHLILHRGWRTRDLEAVFFFQGKIYMFSSEQRIKSQILYVQSVDPSNLRQFNDERQVMEIPNMKGWMARFHFKLSRKEDRLLVYSLRDMLSQNIQDLDFHMYGKDMTLEWECTDKIVYDRRSPREPTVKVSDKGDVFIMSLKDDQNIFSLFDQVKNNYLLMAITDQGNIINHYPVNFPNYYIRGLQIEQGVDHDLSCVGFYSPTHFRGTIDGMFYFEIDNVANKIVNTRFHEIEPYFLNEAMNRGDKKEMDEMFSYDIKHLILRNNRNFIMIAELRYDQNYDNFMNIMVASFSPGGGLNWKTIIPKRQSFDPKYGLNYASFGVHAPWYSDQIYLVYNDNPKNGLWPDTDKVRTFNGSDRSILKTVGIGPSGELTTSIIYRKTRRRMKTPMPMV